MPGFNTRDFDDEDIFFRLMAAMSVVQPYVQFRGVIYVDSMNETRVTPSAVKILTWLSLFCGQQYMPNVLIVTTYWDKLGEDGIKDKLSLIEKWKNEELLQGLCKHGVGFYHHGLVKEKGEYKTLHIERKAEERRSLARNVIMTRFAKSTDLRLQIYIEIAKGATVDETSAGRWLLHGHAADNSQDHGKEHTDDSSRRASSENEQKSQNEEDASANADTGPSSDSSRSDTYFAYWKDLKYEHVKPWINLLFKAAKVYMSSSREEITFEDDEWPDFNEDDDWPNLFQDDWSSSEHVFDPKPRSRSGWCPIM